MTFDLTQGKFPSGDLLDLVTHGQITPTAPPAADAFQQAFADIGGAARLAMWADKNPDQFFAMYAKLIPATVKADVTATITVVAPWMAANRLSYAAPPTVPAPQKEGD